MRWSADDTKGAGGSLHPFDCVIFYELEAAGHVGPIGFLMGRKGGLVGSRQGVGRQRPAAAAASSAIKP